MFSDTQMLSVLNISEICDVARSTASYWITSKGLPARRSGNKFMVSTQDLIIFLESIGRPIPQALMDGLGGVLSHPFKSYLNCWEYWQKDKHGENCRTLTVVFMEGLEPLCWEENGKPMGEQPEIAQYVISKLGIKAKFLFLPWARAQKMVEEGKADLMMTTPNRIRYEYAVFGKEMTTPNYWNVFIRKDNAGMMKKAKYFKKIEDLKPYTVLDFIGNGWTETYMKKSDGYKIEETPRMEQNVLKLVAGRGDLIMNSSTSMNWFLRKLGVEDKVREFRIVSPATRFHMTFMVSRKSPWLKKGLIRALDIELKKMKETGEWLKVLKKYNDPYGAGVPFKTLIDTSGFYKDYYNYPVYKPGK